MYQLYLVLQQRAYNWMKSGNHNQQDIDGAFTVSWIVERMHALIDQFELSLLWIEFQVAKTSLIQCIGMLKYESEGSPEFRLLETANDDLLSLEEFLAQEQINWNV